jgi:hypothetical protein
MLSFFKSTSLRVHGLRKEKMATKCSHEQIGTYANEADTFEAELLLYHHVDCDAHLSPTKGLQ